MTASANYAAATKCSTLIISQTVSPFHKISWTGPIWAMRRQFLENMKGVAPWVQESDLSDWRHGASKSTGQKAWSGNVQHHWRISKFCRTFSLVYMWQNFQPVNDEGVNSLIGCSVLDSPADCQQSCIWACSWTCCRNYCGRCVYIFMGRLWECLQRSTSTFANMLMDVP